MHFAHARVVLNINHVLHPQILKLSTAKKYTEIIRKYKKVLEDFPSVQMPFAWLVQLTPPLKKRAFSISSSPLAHPNQIHLTVSIVSWLTPFKRTRHAFRFVNYMSSCV